MTKSLISRLESIQQLSDPVEIKSKIAEILSDLKSHSSSASSRIVSDSSPRSAVSDRLVAAVIQSDMVGVTQALSEVGHEFDVLSVMVDSNMGVTLLHKACEIGKEGVLTALLAHVDSHNKGAMFMHNLAGEMLKQKIEDMFNHTWSMDGLTPLHFAVMSSSPGLDKTVTELLRRGANPDIPAKSTGKTAFLTACELGEAQAAMLMIQATKGACLSSKDLEGNTCLHLAAENGNEEIVEILMNSMPTLEREVNDKNESAIDVAIENGYEAIAETIAKLVKKGNDDGTFIFS